jgi:peptidase inhibitor family I36
MSTKLFSTIALCALVGITALAPRQATADRDRRGRDRVCVYEHADYQGWEQCYRVGEVDRDLGDRRNSISSVRIQGRAEITLFEHPRFGGRDVVIDNDVSDLSRLGGWNDETDSLRVGFGGRDDGPRDGGPDRGGGDRVCVYEHANYTGASRCFDRNDDDPDLKNSGWNDRISSIRTQGRLRITIYEHTGFQGQNIVVDRDIPDLNQIRWNDRISSLRMGGGGWGDRDGR